jgi:metal-responsive CopG/Arc/MetJ family transcriptional regulator
LAREHGQPDRLVRVTIVMPLSLYERVERKRGLVKRSTYIVDLIQRMLRR